jgi:hypothetical protein
MGRKGSTQVASGGGNLGGNPGGSGQIPCLEGLLFEAVHQLTQVVASIAKSGPEHYADISFFARFGEKYLIPALESVQLSIPCF